MAASFNASESSAKVPEKTEGRDWIKRAINLTKEPRGGDWSWILTRQNYAKVCKELHFNGLE